MSTEPSAPFLDEIDDEFRSLFSEDFVAEIGAQQKRFENPQQYLQRLFSTPAVSNKRIIVLDLMFPDATVQDGLRSIREIRETLPGAFLIVYTNVTVKTIRQKAIDNGADLVLSKVAASPETVYMAVKRWLGHEVRTASALCEVIEVDEDVGMIRVRVPGREGWVAERSFRIDFCPRGARQVGGAFWVDTIERRGEETTEYIVRARAVDSVEEQEFLGRIPDLSELE